MALTIKKYYYVPNRKDLFGYAIYDNQELAKGRDKTGLIFYKKIDASEYLDFMKKTAKKAKKK